MKYKKMKLTALLLLGFGLTEIQAQEAIPASGGDATGSGGSVSYTIGQVAYTTNTGINGSVAQGVQQPFEISIVTGTDNAEGIVLQCAAYPNPTTDFLILTIENATHANLDFQLFDFTGKLLESEQITGKQATITMSHLPVATYFLKVNNNNIAVQSFQIIKN